MRNFLYAKDMARTFRVELKLQGVDISHAQALEIVSHQFGVKDWNVFANHIKINQEMKKDWKLPKGWRISKTADDYLYQCGLDPDEPNVATIRCRITRDSAMRFFGECDVLMQSVRAANYRGKIFKLSADLKTSDADKASLWIRVDDNLRNVVLFDNRLPEQEGGGIVGDNDWKNYSSQLDIPRNSEVISYGFLLWGYGRVSARNLKILSQEHNDFGYASSTVHDEPENLDFNQTI